MKPNESVLKEFNLQGDIEFLPGGEGKSYKVGAIVLKHVDISSEEYTNWVADLFSKIEENGFRVAKPVKNVNGNWVTPDGWSAWEFLEGNHDYKDQVKQSIDAIITFHNAIKSFPKPVFLGEDDTPYIRADKYTWGARPKNIHPDLKDLVESLYSLRKPVNGLENQIIHGDLNPDNILVSDSLPPAIIDMTPYWRPAEFALAIYAYWIACYRDEQDVLNFFKDIKKFDQMLVRAGIRMLLIMSEFNKIHELDKYKRATEIVLQRVR